MSEIQNFDVGTKFGPFTIHVVSRTGEKRKIITSEFQKQAFKKRTYLDRRVLHIHADGIDVKDELGETIYLDDANKTATIQRDNFLQIQRRKATGVAMARSTTNEFLVTYQLRVIRKGRGKVAQFLPATY